MCIRRSSVPYPCTRAFCVVLVSQHGSSKYTRLVWCCCSSFSSFYFYSSYLSFGSFHKWRCGCWFVTSKWHYDCVLLQMPTNGPLMRYYSDQDNYFELDRWVFLCVVVDVKKVHESRQRKDTKYTLLLFKTAKFVRGLY